LTALQGLYSGALNRILIDLGGDQSPDGVDRRPIFYCVHSLSGFAGRDYVPLAAKLMATVRLVGVQAPRGLMKTAPASGFLPELADQYVQAIVKFQPEGGIILGGWSLGSVLALEMARQFKQRGREVQLLVAIDYVPSSISKLVHYQIVAAKLARAITKKDLRPIVESILSRYRGSKNPADKVFNIYRFEGYHQTFIRWLYDASRQYRLTIQYDGPVLICQASEHPAPTSFLVKEMWKKIAPAPGLTIAVVPGNHRTVLQPPNVEVLARRLIEKIAATAPMQNCSAAIDVATAPIKPGPSFGAGVALSGWHAASAVRRLHGNGAVERTQSSRIE
jgi:thioesterase domain-containing protein